MHLIFMGELKTLRVGTKAWERKSRVTPAVRVTQGFPEGEPQGRGGLGFYLVV